METCHSRAEARSSRAVRVLHQNEEINRGGFGGCESHTTLSEVTRTLGVPVSYDCRKAD